MWAMASSSLCQKDMDHDFEVSSRRSRIRTAGVKGQNALPSCHQLMSDGELDVAGGEASQTAACEHEASSPNPSSRAKDKRCPRLNRVNKGKIQREKNQHGERQRSTTVVHLPSREGKKKMEEEAKRKAMMELLHSKRLQIDHCGIVATASNPHVSEVIEPGPSNISQDISQSVHELCRKGFATSPETDLYDSDEDPEIVPAREVETWKQRCRFLEKETRKREIELEKSKQELREFKRMCIQKDAKTEDLMSQVNNLLEENKEISELRQLNHRLQEQILGLLEGSTERHSTRTIEGREIERMDITIGNATVPGAVYAEISSRTTLCKFTKDLAVAVWGTDILKTRSVSGQKCRNRHYKDGKQIGDTEAEPRPRLTPLKLSAITDEMRKYMKTSHPGVATPDREKQILKRNKFISDKIIELLRGPKRKIHFE